MLTAKIHSLQSMGAVDGPGLRYTVFFQGCPLRCVYCHNPDTWDFQNGDIATVDQLLQKIQRCLPYLKGGGVTATGGEPLMQAEFVAELFRRLREEGIHTALDTSGIAPESSARLVLEHTSLVLADLKFTTEEDYRRLCGGSLDAVLHFLSLTRERRIPLWVRHVVVPGLTDSAEHARRFAEITAGFPNLERIELLPFHKLCLEKYRDLGIAFPLENTPAAQKNDITRFRSLLQACGETRV